MNTEPVTKNPIPADVRAARYRRKLTDLLEAAEEYFKAPTRERHEKIHEEMSIIRVQLEVEEKYFGAPTRDLLGALQSIARMTDPDSPGNYRSDSGEDCLDAVYATACDAINGAAGKVTAAPPPTPREGRPGR